MADEWQDMTLGDVLTLQRGFDLPSQKRNRFKVSPSSLRLASRTIIPK